MGLFGRKKEEKKKFDYSEDTKEMFAERDAFYAEQRRKMGGSEANPEMSNQSKPTESQSREEDMKDILGSSDDFNPYVGSDTEETASTQNVSVPAPQTASSAAYSCASCGKEFQEKWGKCPSCGGEMKKAESQPSAAAPSVQTPVEPSVSSPTTNSSAGDPLDDLLGDFGDSNPPSPPPPPSSRTSSKRRVKKVRKVKRPRN